MDVFCKWDTTVCVHHFFSYPSDLISSTKTALDLPLLPFITLEELFKSASSDSPSDSSLRKDAFEKDIITSLLDRLEELCLQNTNTKTTQEKK